MLHDEAEIDLMRRLAAVSRARSRAPRRRTSRTVSRSTSTISQAPSIVLWNKGKDLPQLRFVNQTDQDSTEARLALVHAMKGVLASGLAILGVTAPDEMR